MTKKPVPVLDIFPPLINSSNPWASTLDDLRILYACPYTGAVTTRTSLINGFDHDDRTHKYIFLDSESQYAVCRDPRAISPAASLQNGSINSLGYSPYTLETYLSWIKLIAAEKPAMFMPSDPLKHGPNSSPRRKGFIISVTGTPLEITTCYKLICQTQNELEIPLAMEINLSCPNIRNKPPPAYSKSALGEYLTALKVVLSEIGDSLPRIPIGLKTPPYTYQTQFRDLIDALLEACDDNTNHKDGQQEVEQCLISFLTATNTLGSCLAFYFNAAESSWPLDSSDPASRNDLSGELTRGIGGLAGAPLHPLALGNVATLWRLLRGVGDEDYGRGRKLDGKLGHVRIIGIGGVLDGEGFRRMGNAGASVIGIGTGLGLKGVRIFEEVTKDLGGDYSCL